MSSYLKDPDEVLDYLIDFTSRLVSGESITAVEIVAPSGITVAPSGHPTTFTDKAVTVWLSGGTVGSKLNVTARVTTSAGRVKEQAIRVRIFERAGTSTETASPPPGIIYLTQATGDLRYALKGEAGVGDVTQAELDDAVAALVVRIEALESGITINNALFTESGDVLMTEAGDVLAMETV